MENKTKIISLQDLEILLEDKVFVDYLNVFTSLPIFSQRMLYRFNSGDFEFDPPITRANMVIDKKKLMKWLLDERISYFENSHLYIDYILNCKLRATPVKTTESSKYIYRNTEYSERVQLDKEFLDYSLGNVLGMCRFREYLTGTAGEPILQFWIEVQRMKSVPNKFVHKKQWLWRELQQKYFKIGGLIQLKNNRMWDVIKDGSAVLEAEDRRLRDSGANEVIYYEESHTSLDILQNLILQILQQYWLHKYFIHLKKAPNSTLAEALPDISPATQVSVKQNLFEIMTGLKMTRGKPLLPANEDKNKEVAINDGKDLFVSSAQVNDNFLTERQTIVTVHESGQVTIDPTDPRVMDRMLNKYCQPGHSSVSVDHDSQETTMDLSQKIEEATKNKAAQRDIIISGSPQALRPRNTHRHIQGFVQANQEYLKGFMEGFSTNLPPISTATCQIGHEKNSDNSLKSSNAVSISTVHNTLPRIHKEERRNDVTRTREPLGLTLPEIKMNNGLAVETRVQESMFASIRHQEPRVSPFMWKDRQSDQHDVVTLQRKTFICSLVADQLAGGPFEAFLQRTDNPCAIKSMHFWHESVVYLSTKFSTTLETYDRVRFQRAKKLVLHHLDVTSTKQLNLPQNVTENLRLLLPADRGDNLLRFAQETVSSILETAWKLYIKVDRMIFNNRCLLSKRMNLIRKILALSDARKAELVKQAEEKEASAEQRRKERVRKESEKTKKKKPKGPSNKVYSLATGTLGGSEQSVAVSETETRPAQSAKGETPRPKSRKNAKLKKGNVKAKLASIRKAKETKMSKLRDINKRTGVSYPQKVGSAKTVEPESKPATDETQLNKTKTTAERRMWRALQLVLFVCRLDCESMSETKRLSLEDIHFDPHVYGSLYIKPLMVARKELEPKKRPASKSHDSKRLRKKTTQQPSKAVSEASLSSDSSSTPMKEEDPMSQYESLPTYARPYKNFRENKWISRPTKVPRTMVEIFTDPVNLEFFKRYVQHTGSDMPILLWEAVEQMKQIKDAKTRHQHITHTFKKFFQNKYNFANLECKSNVLIQLTQMEKITPALLLSAQSVIAKDIESKWLHDYQGTFPQDDTTDNNSIKTSTTMSTTESEKERVFARKAKDWAKSKKGFVHNVRMREQWSRVARRINRFRKALWDHQLCEQFIEFLNQNTAAKLQKYREKGMHPSSAAGGRVAVKKVIKDKLLDMTRLPHDVRFLCETERFRQLCNAATEAAIAGTYGVEDHAHIERKAALIVECYVESEIAPRVRINVSSEIASTISSCYHGGMLDRALFHEATMEIYPHVIYLFERFLQGLNSGILTNTYTSGYQYWSPKRSSLPSDFFNLREKRVRKQCDDDTPQLQFSLMFGLRLMLPTNTYYGNRNSVEQFPEPVQDMVYGNKNDHQSALANDSAFAPKKKSKQYKNMSTKVKTMLSSRRNALVHTNTNANVGFGRRKEAPFKDDLPANFREPGVHVIPKPYKSATSF